MCVEWSLLDLNHQNTVGFLVNLCMLQSGTPPNSSQDYSYHIVAIPPGRLGKNYFKNRSVSSGFFHYTFFEGLALRQNFLQGRFVIIFLSFYVIVNPKTPFAPRFPNLFT
jgi:hypothetical protein